MCSRPTFTEDAAAGRPFLHHTLGHNPQPVWVGAGVQVRQEQLACIEKDITPLPWIPEVLSPRTGEGIFAPPPPANWGIRIEKGDQLGEGAIGMRRRRLARRVEMECSRVQTDLVGLQTKYVSNSNRSGASQIRSWGLVGGSVVFAKSSSKGLKRDKTSASDGGFWTGTTTRRSPSLLIITSSALSSNSRGIRTA